ncbi:MAG: D-alanine--D-alanine ligase family protein [Myxococcota bacterium]
MSALCIGLVYETFGTYPRRAGDPEDWEAEYEPEETVKGLEAALSRLGHRPVRLGSPRDLLGAIARGSLPALDAALSIAEGRDTRNREGWAPSLLEMAGVPLLGSDALSLGLCLDKAWTRRVVAAAGVPVAPGRVCRSAEGLDAGALPAPFPLFVKPCWEGTAKGIREHSKVESLEALRREVERVTSVYRQPALVEAFVPGAEYTVTLVGHRPVRALPVLQRALERQSGIGVHALEGPGRPDRELEPMTPGTLESPLEATLQSLAVTAFETLECRDFARIDFRLDAGGRPVFLEINPLPTFAPDGSFGILAELAGREWVDLLAEVLGEALERVVGGASGRRPAAPGAPRSGTAGAAGTAGRTERGGGA